MFLNWGVCGMSPGDVSQYLKTLLIVMFYGVASSEYRTRVVLSILQWSGTSPTTKIILFKVSFMLKLIKFGVMVKSMI